MDEWRVILGICKSLLNFYLSLLTFYLKGLRRFFLAKKVLEDLFAQIRRSIYQSAKQFSHFITLLTSHFTENVFQIQERGQIVGFTCGGGVMERAVKLVWTDLKKEELWRAMHDENGTKTVKRSYIYLPSAICRYGRVTYYFSASRLL